ncbi:MAG TPA: YbhB/YbcL family Raf kinase inhibitor-like protein [Pseudolabrys sp.]|nr:YbhB/YbcL family Raf kinase inhibitor-like protein [Pseudolabrys sp.]
MLENLPASLGTALKDTRPGLDKLTINARELEAPLSLQVDSTAFSDGAAVPQRFTADGAGLSPPLRWIGAPDEAACAALVVEDADSPTPNPLVHAIAPLLPANGEMAEGALAGGDGAPPTGRNSYMQHGFLALDPPPAHGAHRYAFQVFALREAPDQPESMGRSALVHWMKSRVLAKGCLIGTYERT